MAQRFRELPSGNQEIGNIKVCLGLLRIDINCLVEFLVSPAPILELEKGLRQLIVGLRIVGVHLNRVTKLNGGFPVFPSFEVTLSTLKVLLLAHVGVTRTPSQ